MTGSRNPMEDSHRDATALIRAAAGQDWEGINIILRCSPDLRQLAIMLAMMMVAELRSFTAAMETPGVIEVLDRYQAVIRQRLAEDPA